MSLVSFNPFFPLPNFKMLYIESSQYDSPSLSFTHKHHSRCELKLRITCLARVALSLAIWLAAFHSQTVKALPAACCPLKLHLQFLDLRPWAHNTSLRFAATSAASKSWLQRR